jgi:ABC-type glycerol-3-phosphate transport system substrate-binding protein
VLRSIVESFAAQSQDRIRVRLEYHVDLRTEVLTAASAGTPPDVVITSCDNLSLFASRGLAAPLATYQNDPTFGLTAAQVADLWPIVLQGCLDTSSGQPLGLLLDIQAQLLYYNSAWLKRLKTDAPPVSWDQFRTLSNAARDKKAGTWGFAFDGSSLSASSWIASLGGSLLDKSGKLSLASSAAGEALATLNDLRQDGSMVCSYESGAARQELASEKALFTIDSSSQLKSYQEAILNPKTQKVKFSWGLAPLPSVTSEPAVMVEGLTVGILRTSPGQQLAAWLLIKWLLEPPNDASWVLATGSLPMHRSTLDLPELKPYSEALPQYLSAVQLMAYAQTEPASPKMPMIRGLLSEAARAVCQGEAGPQEALLAADTAAEIILAR